MTAVERLFEEHALILQVIEALDVLVNQLEADTGDYRGELVRLMAFFSQFADHLHHEKEESVLLPALVDAGLRWDDGVIAEVRRDHELERQMLQSLRHCALQNTPWSMMDRQRILDVGHQYADFMRRHITTEDELLRPLITSALNALAFQQLNERLERFDSRFEASGELAKHREFASLVLSKQCAIART
jgi:hemerythrin-like domain-containing protein